MKKLNDKGFSLIELVVSIGTIGILSSACCLTGYNEFMAGQRQDAVEIAVDFVSATALQNENGFDERFTAESAVEDFNDSDAGETVQVSVHRAGDGCLTFTGEFLGESETAQAQLKCD